MMEGIQTRSHPSVELVSQEDREEERNGIKVIREQKKEWKR